jgi:DNA end-binding protein Ku
MAARSTWRGNLKLSLVSCPIRMMPAATRANRVSFHNLNPKTLNRVEMRPHDSETREELDDDDLVMGYEFEKGRFVTVEDEELDALEVESSHTIELDRFVDEDAIDLLYFDAPYFIAPDGPAADETFRVIHSALERERKIGLGRVVLNRRERVVAVRTRGKGLMLMTLRAANEVRNEEEYFEGVEAKVDPEKVELATEVVDRHTTPFDPAALDDRYDAALRELVEAKRKGQKPVAPKGAEPAPVIDLMAALKRSLQAGTRTPPAPRKEATEKPDKAEKKRKTGPSRVQKYRKG